VDNAFTLLAAQCTALWQPGGRAAAGITGMFLLGAGGSVAHCGAMCGPLVLGQVADRMAAMPIARLCEAHRLRNGLLLPYHAGRLTTYAALGALAGAAGLAFEQTLAPLRTVLLLIAATMLLAGAFGRLHIGHGGTWPRRWARGLNRSGTGGTYLFGVVMGFLPCGLLYAALIAACALATPAWGAAGMLAFGLGTAPVLAAIGVAGHMRRVQGMFARVAPWLMAFNAAVLVLAAVGGVLL
jgi:uncharacterized protein